MPHFSLATLALLALVPGARAQTTWHVDAAGSAPGSGTQADPYTRVDFALAQPTTLSGDTLLVAPADYTDEEIDFLGKDLHVIATGGPALTRLIAPTQLPTPLPLVRFTSGEGAGAVLEGFHLTGVERFNADGGAVLVEGSSATLRDCEISDNAAFTGGGVRVVDGNLLLDGTRLEGNEADTGAGLWAERSVVRVSGGSFLRNATPAGAGGGAYGNDSRFLLEGVVLDDNEGLGAALFGRNTDFVLRDCTLRGNGTSGNGEGCVRLAAGAGGSFRATDTDFIGNVTQASDGGAIAADEVILQRCTFRANRATFDDHRGGAIACARLEAFDCVFEDNRAARGGAVQADEVDLSGCVFLDNRAQSSFGFWDGSGGALVADSGSLRRCVFAGNEALAGNPFVAGGEGGAVLGTPALELRQCTLFDNDAVNHGGGSFGSTLIDSIARSNTPDQLDPQDAATYCDIEGGFPGVGNFDLDPLFVSPGGRDFHLTLGSPCIDAGDPTSPPDVDGSRADVGALPFECGERGVHCMARPNSAGPGARLTATGTLDVVRNDMRLEVERGPASVPGLFFYGSQAISVPFGDGTRCAGGSVFRLFPPASTDPSGRATRAVDLSAPPAGSGAGQIQPGSTWYFQFWFRDPQGPGGSGFNLSEGLRLVFCP